MARFFTADTHFSYVDEDVFTRDFRPFKSIKKMNNTIIKIWNKQAGKDDVIYHLGDFVNYNMRDNMFFKKCFELVKKIKAKVILIIGNNEEKIIKHEYGGNFAKLKEYLLSIGFADVIRKGITLEIGGQKVYLTHCPVDHKEGMENLFGHIHGTGFVKKYGFNVGVDNHYLRLFSEEEIIDMFSRRDYFDENVYE